MLDHLLGRPSASFKRSQVVLVLAFWLAVVIRTPRDGPRALYLRKLSRILQRFTPWQIVCATLTAVYALRHIADVVGLGSPEPLSRLYSRAYYRATWVATAFDAGLATAMPIRPKWIRDLAGFLFAGYYLIYANEADEKLRKFRSTATVEMLRTTWEKPLNPYVRLITRPYRPSLPVVRTLLIPRPATGPRSSLPPVRVVLFFDGPPAALSEVNEMVLDFPGGGFICMGPDCHEERLRLWARCFGRGRASSKSVSRRAVVSVDYGKSPEYPYPWAIEECFDLYLAIIQSNGAVLGLTPTEGRPVELILTGDSAGANIVCTVLFSLLENPLGKGVRLPKAIVLAYAALDFNFTSWMSQENLRVLREETGVKRRTASGVDLSGLEEAKDHLAHRSPLAVVHDLPPRRAPSTGRLIRTRSWSQMFGFGALVSPRTPSAATDGGSSTTVGGEATQHRRTRSVTTPGAGGVGVLDSVVTGSESDAYTQPEIDGEDDGRSEEWKTLRERVRTPRNARSSFSLAAGHAPAELFAEQDPFDRPASIAAQPPSRKGSSSAEEEDSAEGEGAEARVGTRLTMTSRSGFFQDRIITPTMMRAMAILYIGPSQNPDLSTDYYISPLLAPARLLANFPPVLLVCGEKDPFVDDTVVMAGRIREARAQAAGRAADEEDDDWVRMEIMEGWGHGYLQMVALMPEIRGVLEDIAQYMDDAFTGALFHGSTATTTGTTSPLHAKSRSIATARPRSWLGRLLGWPRPELGATDVEGGALDLVEMPTPVTPPPSVNASPPSGRSRSTTASDSSITADQQPRADRGMADDDGEMLAFTPKRLRSPPLRAVPRHGILKKPPPTSIVLPPPFTPPISRDGSTLPTTMAASAAQAGPATLHAQPNAKTLPSLLAAALTRSLTPPSSGLAGGHHASSSAAGTPHSSSHLASSGSTFASTPVGGGGNKQRPPAIDERELMRRRRVDAVFGMELGGGTASASGAGGTEDGSQAEDGMADLLL